MRGTLIKATLLIFSLSLLSKLIGFARSMFMATYFGADVDTDAYYFTMHFVSALPYMAATSIGVMFLPAYVKIRERQGNEQARRYVGEILRAMLLAAFAVMLVLIVMAPEIVNLLAPSYQGEQLKQAVLYLRVMSTGLIFALLVSIYQNVLNAERIYGYSNISSIINSLVLILAVLIFSSSYGIMAAVVSMPLAFFLQWLMLSLRSKSYVRYNVESPVWNTRMKLLLTQSMPIMLSSATVELNQLVDIVLLVSAGSGAVTAVNYAGLLFQISTGLIIMSFGTIAFTEFAEQIARQNIQAMKELLVKILHMIFLVGLPLTIISIFYAEPITALVFGHGNFDDAAIRQTSLGFMIYAICIMPVCVKQILIKAFYALEDTRLPMLLSMAEMAVNTVASIIMAHFWGLAGVVGGTALASTVFGIAQVWAFSRWKTDLSSIRIRSRCLHILPAFSISVVVAFLISGAEYMSLILFTVHAVFICIIFFITGTACRDEVCIDVFSRLVTWIKFKWKKIIA